MWKVCNAPPPYLTFGPRAITAYAARHRSIIGPYPTLSTNGDVKICLPHGVVQKGLWVLSVSVRDFFS